METVPVSGDKLRVRPPSPYSSVPSSPPPPPPQDEDLAKYLPDFRFRSSDRRSQARRKRLALKVNISLSMPG